MQSFHWDTTFDTGLSEVDAQHKRLVEMINRLWNDTSGARAVPRPELEALLGELGAYAVYHFAEEERLMALHRLDPRHRDHHRAAHASFVAEVGQLGRGVLDGDPERLRYLAEFLTNWLIFHMLGSDQAMASQIEAVVSGRSPAEAFEVTQHSADPATGALLSALNRLFDQLSERNLALVAINETLERRVAERTLALSDANARLEAMALTDVLTGLPNRRHAMQTLQAWWESSNATGRPLSCMLIDADGFKQVNDRYGHEAGDEVLRRLSHTLTDSVRNDDRVFRLGGDEFLILCPATNLDGAMHAAEKVRGCVNGLTVSVGDGAWRGSISVGVATRTDAEGSIEALIKRADEGVYQAKRNGRNCVATVCR